MPTERGVVDLAAADAFTAVGGLCSLAGAALLRPESAGRELDLTMEPTSPILCGTPDPRRRDVVWNAET